MVTRFTHVSVLRDILFRLENLFHNKIKLIKIETKSKSGHDARSEVDTGFVVSRKCKYFNAIFRMSSQVVEKDLLQKRTRTDLLMMVTRWPDCKSHLGGL